MRAIFDKVTGLRSGGLLTESSDRILTEDSNVVNEERGLTKLAGWAAQDTQRFITTNTPSSPTKSEGLAYDSDGALHVSATYPSGPTMLEGLAISSSGALHVFDTSSTLLTELTATITTEAGATIVAESPLAVTFGGFSVTESGQLCYS